MIKYNPTSHPEVLKGRATMLSDKQIDDISEKFDLIWQKKDFARAIEKEVLGGSEPVCKCSVAIKVLGDGCEVCNPELTQQAGAEPVGRTDWSRPGGVSWMLPDSPGIPEGLPLFTHTPDSQAEINRLNEVIKGYQDDQKETIGKWATDYRKQAERIAELEGLAEHWNIVDAANKIASLTAALELAELSIKVLRIAVMEMQPCMHKECKQEQTDVQEISLKRGEEALAAIKAVKGEK